MSTVHQSEIGEVLQRAVQNTLGVFAQRVSVRVEGDRVHLYGYVHSNEERAKLEKLVLSVPGVSEVANHLCVNLFA